MRIITIRPSPALALVAAATLGTSLGAVSGRAAPPFAGDPDSDQLPPKPETRQWNVTTPSHAVSFLFEPGIPDPNQTTTITIVPSKRSKGSSPLGGADAIEGARMIVTVKSPDGEVLGRYRTHPNPLSKSKYAFHYTPIVEGVHTLHVDGKAPDGKTFEAEVKMPVAVWPLPKELQGKGDAVPGGGVKRPITGPITK